MPAFSPTIAMLPDMLTGVLGVVAVMLLCFGLITLVASYYRFQHIVRQAEDTQPADMGASPFDILRVQLARYLGECSRRGTSFSISLIQVNDPGIEVRMDSPFIESLKKAARIGDIICIYDEHVVAVLTETEPEDSESTITRIITTVSKFYSKDYTDLFRVGIASYPGHGSRSKDLLDVATESLEQTDEGRPIVMPEIVKIDEEDDEDLHEHEENPTNGEAASETDPMDIEPEKEEKGWKGRRKSAMLDELTGVLKPSAVSAYMQRTMSDLRYKKKKAALFCVGVNNIDHIARFHGEEAVDDVLVGVSKILQGNLRADDLIGRHEKYAFLILAAASLKEAEVIGKRISTLVQHSEITSGSKKIRTTITLGVATYPEHGRNLHTLYKAGQKVLDHSRANDIRAYAVYDPKIHDSMPSKPMKNIKSIKA